MMGVKVVSNKDSIKIYGNPNLKLNKDYIIKNFLEDHRVFMMSVISALSLGGRWKIFDPDSVKTSFPSFLKSSSGPNFLTDIPSFKELKPVIYSVPIRIFTRLIDLARFRQFLAELCLSKSQKNDFWPKNR